ncbi:MAG: Arm DNA-binding domain-containing protein, partial [Coprobacillaceae bacterium]
MPPRKYKDHKKRLKWMFDVSYKRLDGTPNRERNYGFKTKQEAEDAERIFLNKQEMYHKVGNIINFEQACQEYLSFKNDTVRKKSTKLHKYFINNCILPYLSKVILNDFTSIKVVKWQNQLIKDGKSNRTVNRARRYLKSIYSLAKYNHNLQGDPFRTVEKLKEKKKKIVFLTREELDNFLSVINDFEYYAIYNFMFFTG